MPDLWMDVDAALAEVPVNIFPLLDDTDFKSIEGAVAYNAAGMALRWHFVTTAGAYTVASVTPTTGGNYDWTDQGDSGIYTIEIPASGGASANNDTEGFGWFTGVATGVLPWRGPTIGFRRAALNDLLIDGSTASTNLEDFFDGTGYVGGTAKFGIDVVNWKGSAAPAMTGDAYARLGAPVGASVSADVLQIKNYVDDIGAAGAGLSAIPWNAAWDAEVQSEVNDELVLQNLDHLLKTATAGVDMTTEVTDGSVISRIISNSDTSLFVPATSNLTTVGAAILADTNELQTDWVNGGRLDLILDIIAADTTTDIPALIADVPTVAEFEARTLVAADYVVVGDTLAAVTTVGSVTGAVGSVTGAVGSVTGAVGSVAANGITATSIAADAINAAAVKADAVTKIQNGLATPTNITAGTITTVTNLTNAPTNGDLTATMKTSVNAEVDTALNTAIPGSPTADSINERIATMDTSIALMRLLLATGTVVDDNDPDPTATAFETDLAEASNDHYNGAFLVFTSGALLDQSRKVAGYVGATKVITTSAFTEAPAGGDTFAILGRSE